MDVLTYQVCDFKHYFLGYIKSQGIVLYCIYVCVHMKMLCNVCLCPSIKTCILCMSMHV